MHSLHLVELLRNYNHTKNIFYIFIADSIMDNIKNGIVLSYML